MQDLITATTDLKDAQALVNALIAFTNINAWEIRGNPESTFAILSMAPLKKVDITKCQSFARGWFAHKKALGPATPDYKVTTWPR